MSHKQAYISLLFLALALLIAHAGCACASEEEACLAGTWGGTIGGRPVTLWFEFGGEGAALTGLCYYSGSDGDLPLVGDDAKPGRWKEFDTAGRLAGYLTLDCRGGSLSGFRSPADGGRTSSVEARGLDPGWYLKQRLEAAEPKAVSRERIGVNGYEVLSVRGYESVTGVRLKGKGKALKAVNAALMKSFRSNLGDAMECFAYGLMRRGRDHGYAYEYSMDVVDWNSEFVVVREASSSYCGGLHPLSGASATTYSLRTGMPEDVSAWLAGGYRKDIPKDSPLGKTLVGHYREMDMGAGCLDVVSFSGDVARPSSEGLSFRPDAPYAYSSCISEVTVPYGSLSPYLSPEGKVKIKAFQGG
jgi:hypothetical protein